MSDSKEFKKRASKSAFGKNLAKELEKRESTKEAAPPEKPAFSKRDSFARRLADTMKPADAAQSDSSPGEQAPEPRIEGSGGDESADSVAGAVGGGEHVVRQGECISSIAKDTGHFCDTIWDDAGNTALREARKDAYVLLPGDRVHVPPLRERWEPRPTEARHRFRRRGWPEMLRVRVLSDGEPRANQPFTLEVDGKSFGGTTQADGRLSCPIVPNAKHATLRIGVEPDVREYVLALGGIDPINAVSGIQGRLNNLGFDCGAVDGIKGGRTEAALREFQRSRRLTITGDADEATRRQLQTDYGC